MSLKKVLKLRQPGLFGFLQSAPVGLAINYTIKHDPLAYICISWVVSGLPGAKVHRGTKHSSDPLKM